MRTLLALGNGHRPERRVSDDLRTLRRGGAAIQSMMVREESEAGEEKWCAEQDLNLHTFRHYHLKVACLPIPPYAQPSESKGDFEKSEA